ncbi:MAG: c-type cytochrome domain-containing protein [Gammaproteobacteria bacterium]|jgi:hypothetical protein
MQLSIHTVLSVLVIAVITAGCGQDKVSYKEDVLPILENNCFVCHDGKGEGSQASGFVLLTYDDLMKGTKYGQVVVPGDSASSTLYLMIDHKVDPMIQMPPHHNTPTDSNLGPLSRDTIATVKNWIDQGAEDN